MDENIIKVLSGRPIAFHRAYVDITGSVTAGLLMSQLLYWASVKEKFYKSNAEIREETGLGEHELKKAKKDIAPFFEITLEGVPAITYYRPLWSNIAVALNKLGGNRPTGWAETAQHSISEITTESSESGFQPSSLLGDSETPKPSKPPQSKTEPTPTPLDTAEDPPSPEEEVTFEATDRDGEVIQPKWGKKPKAENMNKKNEDFLRQVEKMYKKRFLVRPKQYKALNTMRANGITGAEIQACIDKMMERDFYKENGWDMMTVLSELSRGCG